MLTAAISFACGMAGLGLGWMLACKQADYWRDLANYCSLVADAHAKRIEVMHHERRMLIQQMAEAAEWEADEQWDVGGEA